MSEENRPVGVGVHWRNQEPLKPIVVSKKTPSERLLELAMPKKSHGPEPVKMYQYSCGHPDPLPTPKKDVGAKLNARLERLSRPIGRVLVLLKFVDCQI